MNNFEMYNPVKVIFGKGSISRISELIPENAKFGLGVKQILGPGGHLGGSLILTNIRAHYIM